MKVKATRGIAAPRGEVFLGPLPTGDGVNFGESRDYSSLPCALSPPHCHQPRPAESELGRTGSSAQSITLSIAGGSPQSEPRSGAGKPRSSPPHSWETWAGIGPRSRRDQGQTESPPGWPECVEAKFMFYNAVKMHTRLYMHM